MTFKQFLQRLFPKFFKQPVSSPVEAPRIDAVIQVATPVAQTPQVASQPVVAVPVAKDPIDHAVTGAVIGSITEALTGKITGTGTGYVVGGTPGPFSPTPVAPLGPRQPGVLDQPGVPVSLSLGLNKFIVPVRVGQKTILTTADFYDQVEGTLFDSAGNVMSHDSNGQGKVYFYVNPDRSDDLRLEITTNTTNPQAHVERQGDA
jgi:hypothetical protein